MRSTGRRCALILLFAASVASAEDLQYAVTGVGEPLSSNVLNHVKTVRLGRQARLDEDDYAKVIADAEARAREALRPYGYYRPQVTGHIERTGADALVLGLDVDAGPPLRVAEAHVELIGAGAGARVLREWRDAWPLRPGAILDQAAWEEQKQQAIEIAEAAGFLAASFTTRKIELDLTANTAVLRLTLDTGPQFVFGDIDFGEHALKDGILEFIPRFRKGQPYSARMLDKFRVDLWKTGYFTDVDVVEVDRPEATPPAVDLNVKLETEHKNVYQGSLGMGSDTGLRMQAQWSRHPMSRNGDRLDIGAGWQEADDEASLHVNYRLPRRSRAREYWVAEAFMKYENLDLEVKQNPEDEDFIKIANGDVEEFHLRGGRLKIRNFKSGDQQLFATWFVQFLNSKRVFIPFVPLLSAPGDPDFERLLKNTDNAYSVGLNFDVTDVRGKGFDTHGRRDQAWLFASSRSLGSDMDFTQAYLGTRRIWRRGDRVKILVRGEIGYTEARVDNFSIDVDGQAVDLSVTRLPNFYRFKAGGSNSVRGYGFESLSDNDIGSNNVVTASASIEVKFLENWSAAAFVDIGNAFNDWSNADLRRGAGVGIRWYSIAGPIRIDFANALDITGRPWRVHFTIGTPLL